MEKKFELTDNFVINALGIKLFQIKCTKAFKNANEGDLGGYVEKEENLSQSGDAWVYGNAQVYGDAWVYGNAQVYGDARVSGDAWVSGDARVENDHMHCGFDCFGSCNRHTHAYMTNENKVEIRCGCFRGSIEEFERKVKETHAGTIYEKQYKAIINLIKIKFGIDG